MMSRTEMYRVRMLLLLLAASTGCIKNGSSNVLRSCWLMSIVERVFCYVRDRGFLSAYSLTREAGAMLYFEVGDFRPALPVVLSMMPYW